LGGGLLYGAIGDARLRLALIGLGRISLIDATFRNIRGWPRVV
jgi:hypothetical protein